MQHSSLTRRGFLSLSTATSLLAFAPRLVVADADTRSRFVVVILRGALDGLSAVVPYGDARYARIRGELAIANADLKLDETFALHPSLTFLHARYIANELIAFHAIASPYRERSHFDGQDVLENGTSKPSARDGWLNRVLQTLPQRSKDPLAIALSQNVPLVLRGDAPVNSWSPSRLPTADSDTLQRIADLYSTDQYFASRLQAALATDAIAGETRWPIENGIHWGVQRARILSREVARDRCGTTPRGDRSRRLGYTCKPRCGTRTTRESFAQSRPRSRGATHIAGPCLA